MRESVLQNDLNTFVTLGDRGVYEMKYKNRPYLKDFETGEVLDTTVMYDNSERIVGTANVIRRLRVQLLPKAKESLKVTESDFRGARGSFTDLIDAQRILLEFALSYERALADRSQSLAKLEMIVGQEIDL